MNLKERGITVGDLLLISIFIISLFFIINKVKDRDKQAHYYINPSEVRVFKENQLF